VELDELLHEGETDARPRLRARARLIDLIESLEHVPEMLGRDPRARVGDTQQNAGPRGRDVEDDSPTRGCELESVGEQVGEHLFHGIRIEPDHHLRWFGRHPELDPLLLGNRREGRGHTAGKDHEVLVPRAQLHLARLELCNVEKLVHET